MPSEDTQPTLDQASRLFQFGELAARAGRYKVARAYYAESLSLYRQLGADRFVAWALVRLADVTCRTGTEDSSDPFAMIDRLRMEALPLFEQEGDKRGEVACLSLAAMTSPPEQQREILEKVLTLMTEERDTQGKAWSLFQLGQMEARAGDKASAEELYRRGRTLLEEQKHKTALANMKLREGLYCRIQHEYERATTLYEEALLLYRELENKRGIAQTLMTLEGFSGRTHSPEYRTELLIEAVLCSREAGIRAWEAGCYLRLIEIAEAQGDAARVEALCIESSHLADEMEKREAKARKIDRIGGL